jgi:hypothetical protein
MLATMKPRTIAEKKTMGQALLLACCAALALTAVRADEPPAGPRIEPYTAGPELTAKMAPYRLKAYAFIAEDGAEMSFLLAGPEAQARPGERYPLILFLHGLGEHGPGLERVFHQPHIFELSKPEAQQRNPCYIVAPQHPKGGHWWAPSFTCPHECAATAMALLQEVVRRAQPATRRTSAPRPPGGGWTGGKPLFAFIHFSAPKNACKLHLEGQ